MGIVQVLWLHLFWNTGSIYNGLLHAKIMIRKCFFLLLAFLHVMDPEDENVSSTGKLRKVYRLLQDMNEASAKFSQPQEELAKDARIWNRATYI